VIKFDEFVFKRQKISLPMAEKNEQKTEKSTKKPPQSAKKKILRVSRNLILSILLLGPIAGYLGTTYTVQSLSPTDKAPYCHFNGLDPHSEVYISWETEDKEPSYIEYGYSINQITQFSKINTTSAYMHRMKLDNLTANTKYFYRTGESNSKIRSNIRTFKTAPEAALNGFNDFNITVTSDTQQLWGTGHYDTLMEQLAKWSDTDFLAYAGDVGQEPDDQETWNFFWQQTAKISDHIPLVPAPGNHDWEYSNDLYTKYFGVSSSPDGANYAFNWSNTQFIMAEIANGGDVEPQKNRSIEHDKWMNKTLQAGQNQKYRVLMFHRQMFSSLGNNNDLIARFAPIIEKYNISLVLYGHMHMYERFYYQNHTYVCLGGGGGMQNSFGEYQEITQIMAMGASFTQLLFNDKGITIKTLSPTFDVIDQIELVEQNGLMIPEKITPFGGFN
jgi:Calcineurin-like phosphoesterase/Purple acid Phosphatase, N-terminal domain